MPFFENKCLTKINDTKFGFLDDKPNQPAYLTTDVTREWDAKIINNAMLELDFYAIDNCLIFKNVCGQQESTCDAALKYKNDFLYFIELKDRKRSGWLGKAIKQLENTLKLYNENEELRAKMLKCFVCNKQRPSAPESYKDILAKFKKENNCMLEESYTITIKYKIHE